MTTIVHDYDSTGTPLLMRSDDFNGSGEATYSAALNLNVLSYILSNGHWRLYLYNQSVRTIFLTPNDGINSLQPTAPPPGYHWQYGEVTAGCFDQNLHTVPLGNVVTSSGNCKTDVDFGYNGTEYKIVMGPSLPASGPATGLVTVTCNSVSNGQCVNWTIIPNMTPSSSNPPTVANLYRYTTSGKTTLVLLGQYHHTFRIDLTNP